MKLTIHTLNPDLELSADIQQFDVARIKLTIDGTTTGYMTPLQVEQFAELMLQAARACSKPKSK